MVVLIKHHPLGGVVTTTPIGGVVTTTPPSIGGGEIKDFTTSIRGGEIIISPPIGGVKTPPKGGEKTPLRGGF